MKIENISISNINIDSGSATLTFSIIEVTKNVDVYLKVDESEFTRILTNQGQGSKTYTLTGISRGSHNLVLKVSNDEEEYITSPFLAKFKTNPSIEGLECIYSDSTGKFILKFNILGDELFTYSVNLKLDENEYQEIMTSQIIGEKTFESTDTMGGHTCILKVSDGYDEYQTDVYSFNITNQKPMLSRVLVKDITNNGTASIHYGVKDIENSTLTHNLNINGVNSVITPTRVDSFYSYNISGLSVGEHTCYISITDGIDTITSDSFNIEIFTDSTNKKEILRQSKARYDFAYQSLKDIIISVISDGIFSYDIENEIIQKAQESYNETYSEFNRIAQQSIDTIGTNKINLTKEDLTSQINDVDNALNSLETTMEGVFRDGLLSDSEKILLNDNLNLIAKEKVDVDNDYETLYNNEDLLDPAKSKLKTTYDAFVLAQNLLATTIDNIIKKETIIDNNDKASIDSAFESWRNALGNYRNASLEAIDSIAKKKTDDSFDAVDKKWAEIVLDPDTGIQSQVGRLQEKVTGAGGIEQRLTTAEQTITTEGITNLIKDTHYTKEEINETIKDIPVEIPVAVESVDVQYYLSTSQISLTGGSWSTVAPTWVNGKYMWSKTVTTLTDGTVRESSPTCIAGAKGEDGNSINILGSYNTEQELNQAHPNNNNNGDAYIVGGDLYIWDGTSFENMGQIKGEDGQTLYTWIKYSDYADGTNLYDIPNDNTRYIGISTNQLTETESTNKGDYKWSKFRGDDGADAVSYYTWIRYADDASGNGISNSPDGKKYIGFAYNKTTSTESNTPSDYSWSLIKGEDGKNGTDGKDGISAVTYYTWIKYADDENGSGISNNPTNKKYIGLAYNKTTQEESNTPSDYSWSLIKGEDGKNGTDGKDGIDGKDGTGVKILGSYETESELNLAHPSDNEKGDGYLIGQDLYVWNGEEFQNVGQIRGEDGLTFYTWIKYSDYADGTNLYDTPNDNTQYIGIATNQLIETESTNKGDYKWSKFRGDDGVDGQTFYTWIKYSDNADGTNLYDTPNDNTQYIGIATNQTSSTESTDKSKYRWSKFKGDDGINGIDGMGIVSITEQYYLSTSKTTQTGGSWVETPPTWETGKYLWTRSKIVYKNPTSTEYTTPVCDSSWEIIDDVQKDLQDQIDTNRTEIETTKETVAEHTTNLSNITSRVSTTENQITTINGNITSITNRVNSAEQKITDSAIINTVKSTFYTKDEVNGMQESMEEDISSIEQTTQSIQSTVSSHTGNISTLTQRADSFDITLAGKADTSNIISKINASTEGITISSSKVNITGFVTFSNLSGAGQTTINGGNITTGTIDASKVTVKNLNANNIVSGTIDASDIYVININASNITTGQLSGNYIRGGTIEGVKLRTTAVTSQGGVYITEDALQIGQTTFHYADSRFKIEAVANVSISSMANIYIMAGLNQNGTVSGNGKVYIYTDLVVEGNISCVGGVTAVFG